MQATELYRVYLFAIAFLPMLGLFMSFKEVRKLYAVIGALFMPLLALALLILNGGRDELHIIYINHIRHAHSGRNR